MGPVKVGFHAVTRGIDYVVLFMKSTVRTVRGHDLKISWDDLAKFEIPIARYAFAWTLKEAQDFASTLKNPICLKANTDLHKAALGLVYIGVTSGTNLDGAWTELSKISARLGIAPPFLLQEMVPSGPELFAGVIRDPSFGHVLVAGLGGRLVETIGKKSLRLIPVSLSEAESMVFELSLEALELTESLGKFAKILFNLSELVLNFPEIYELDLNPVILGKDSATVVDLRVLNREISKTEMMGSESVLREDTDSAIRRLISPKSVAVIGASANSSKPGGRAYGYLKKYAPSVKLYGVNTREESIDGTPSIKSIADLPEGIDVAVIATPASSLLEIIDQISKKSISTAVVFASGFGEVGNIKNDHELLKVARANNVRICGVNGMGLIGDAPLTFTQALALKPIAGGISFLTQSGAIGGSLLISAWTNGIGTARFISVGNETDLSLSDFLNFLAIDEPTRVIGIFLEGVKNGRKFKESLRKIRKSGKKIVLLRSGISDVGATAVLSHTGALAGADSVYRQVFKDENVFLVSDIFELLSSCQTLDWQPRLKGRNIGVLSTSGGGCSLVADMLNNLGLEVPELDQQTRAALEKILPAFAPTRNPIDTTGTIASDSTLLGRIIEPVLTSPTIDGVVIAISALVGESAKQIATSIINFAKNSTKPIVVGWMLPESAVAEAFSILRKNHIPVFSSISEACTAMAALSSPAEIACSI